ncbi:hypothetical protein [Lysobacter enzymogenes]|uniref:hypothetical protein n=1 Tax=Lysobacter enzymogenes TaxID=69 RepID=UPI000F4C68CB|nr:hypothetical protein [Lysobacter enzymogenes]
MLRTLLLATSLGGLIASAPLHAERKDPTLETRRQEAQKSQNERLVAISKRGRLSNYQQLLGTGKVAVASSAAAEASSRDAAIDLAALGFTAADVKAYKARNIDLFDVAHRFFTGVTTSTEVMLMADTIVVATAGDVQEGRNRIDGFLSEIPFTVEKSLKGSRVSGDVIRVPRSSGPLPNGTYRQDFSDASFTPGQKYLLILSKNWYEQFVALGKKQAESAFTALPYEAYQVGNNGALVRRSHTTQVRDSLKDLRTVETSLKALSERNNNAGGLQ